MSTPSPRHYRQHRQRHDVLHVTIARHRQLLHQCVCRSHSQQLVINIMLTFMLSWCSHAHVTDGFSLPLSSPRTLSNHRPSQYGMNYEFHPMPRRSMRISPNIGTTNVAGRTPRSWMALDREYSHSFSNVDRVESPRPVPSPSLSLPNRRRRRRTLASSLLLAAVTAMTVPSTIRWPLTATSRASSTMVTSALATIVAPALRGGASLFTSTATTTGGASVLEHAAQAAAASAAAEGMIVTEEMIAAANGWLANLCGPAALVAGAVVATLYENMKSGDLEIRERSESRRITLLKKITKLMLLSAFAFEVMCIFVSILTGTVLLARSADTIMAIHTTTSATACQLSAAELASIASPTPLSFLRTHFEFEFLICRISFLQGLFNWLAAIALSHAIPAAGETAGTRRLNAFVAWSIGTCIILMMSFYNTHMMFYNNYAHMIQRFAVVMGTRFLFRWPPRPLFFAFMPAFLMSLYTGYRSIRDDQPDQATHRTEKRTEEVITDDMATDNTNTTNTTTATAIPVAS